MKLPRVSLLGLMGIIALLAVAIAAYRIQWPEVRVSAFFTLAIFVLLSATLGSLLNRRASWIGFSLFGWSWLIISSVAFASSSWSSTNEKRLVPLPITSIWLLEVHSFVLGNTRQDEAMAVMPNSKGGYTLMAYSLVQMCNVWASLVVAFIGGLLARLLDERWHHSAGE